MRRPSWKVLGLAGLAGVAATGVVVARRRRAQHDYTPDELRERLHARLAGVSAPAGADPAAPDTPTGADPAAPDGPADPA
jgi:hypothetical protein